MSKITKPRVALLLTTLIIAGLLLYFWRNDVWRQSAPSVDERALSKNKIAVVITENTKHNGNTASNKARPATPGYVLPSIQKPIDEVFDELKQASDNGAAKATCRLALELLKCQLSLQWDEKKLEKYVTEKLPGRTDEDLFYIKKPHLERLDIYRECKKLSPDKLLDTADLLERAANQHQLDAMVMWASGQWIKGRYGNSNAYLQDPAFLRWQQNAIPMMNAALQRGSFTAAREWAIAYMFDDPLPFYSLVPDDLKSRYAFTTLAELLENDIPTPPRELSPRDAMAAEAEGRRMFKEYFHGTPIGKENLNNASIVLDDRDADRRDLCNAKP